MTNHEPFNQDGGNTLISNETTRLLSEQQSSSSPSSQQPANQNYHSVNDDLPPLEDEATRLAALKLIPWYKRPSILWLIPFIFVVSLVIGVSSAPSEQAIIQIVCKEHFGQKRQPLHDFVVTADQTILANGTDGSGSPEDPCKSAEVQAVGAILFSQLRALKNITVGFWTSLLDRYGRKSLIWATLIPALFTMLVILYSSTSYNKFGTKLLWIEAFVQGITGGSTLLDPSLQSYAADTTPREGRSLILGYMMVILATGMIIGPGMAAYVIERSGGRYTAALELVTLMILILIPYVIVIPESLPEAAKLRAQREDEAAAREAAKMPGSSRIVNRIAKYLRNVFTPILIFMPGQIETTGDVVPMPHKYTLILLVIIAQLHQFVVFGVQDIFIPYTNTRFHWNHIQNGYYFTFTGVSSLIVFVFLFPMTQWIYKKVFFKKEGEEKTKNNLDSATTVDTSENERPGMMNRDSHAEAVLDGVRGTPGVPRGELTDSLLAEEESVAETAHLLADEADDRLNGNKSHQEGKLEMTRQTTWLEVHIFGVCSVLFFIASIIVPLNEKESTVFVSGFLRSAGQVGFTTYGALLTMYSPPHQVGKVLGGSCVIDTITMTVAALSFGSIFARTSSTMPSFVFWIASLAAFLSILVFLVLWSLYKRHDRRVARQLKLASATTASQ
ncbi:hypothetical protein BGW41_003824 [Actinomortierella wolfii]|nr:hypothetical protein BGW41_003824 [Actinomortierella wolfii]